MFVLFYICGGSCLDEACMVLFWLMVFRAVSTIKPKVLTLQYRYAKKRLVLAFVWLRVGIVSLFVCSILYLWV